MRGPTYRTIFRPNFRGAPRPSDYISVPRLDLLGSYPVVELVRFKLTDKTDPRNVELVLAASAKAQKRLDDRR